MPATISQQNSSSDIAMDYEQWLKEIKQLSVGKVLPKATYIHREALKEIAPELFRFVIEQALGAGIDHGTWNIARLHRDSFKLTLLHYPTFQYESYPSLHESTGIDLASGKIKTTAFIKSLNPPILHRKENMVLPSHPDYAHFCQITLEGERAGLYENTRIIGFKQSWETVIREKGYELVAGRLFRQATFEQESQIIHKIDRHKTAISRNSFSAPVKTLARYGYLEGDYTVFDYGCGHGDDLAELAAHGIAAAGWDPSWRVNAIKTNADLVNLGFVINVIENHQERIEAVHGAWQLADKLLIVSAMIASEQRINKFKPFKDGVLTSRNTFQKYYSQNELQIFLEQILDEEPIPVAPGIFYIFKDKDEEQLFLSRKQRRTIWWRQLVHKRSRVPKRQQILDDNRELLSRFWLRALELGRMPAIDEFDEEELLRQVVGSPKKAFNLVCQEFDVTDLERAERERREDLLVYFALQMFNKRRVYQHMPDVLKRDVKTFWGDYKTVQAEAKVLLFSLAHPEAIHKACKIAHEQLPASVHVDSHSLTLHSRFINDLPPPLRVYLGCATQLYSDTDGVDLVKIHVRSGKVSLMSYHNFETSPIPVLRERVKINLRIQGVDFFDYEYGGHPPQPLYWKSRFIDDTFADYKKQMSFDRRLSSLKLPGMDGFGLNLEDFSAVLRHGYGLEVKGYKFFKIANS